MKKEKVEKQNISAFSIISHSRGIIVQKQFIFVHF